MWTDFLFKSDGKKAYIRAKIKMQNLHDRLNSNIPDYNPFELPTNKDFVKYPKSALLQGRIYQRNLVNKSDIRIYELNYMGNGQLFDHTHYGFFEFIFIKYGTFLTSKGIPYTKGDVIMIDGYDDHSLKCLTESGSILIAFSPKKTKLNIKCFYKHIK